MKRAESSVGGWLRATTGFSRRTAALFGAFVGVGLLLATTSAHATTVTVNTTRPNDPSDGKCGWVEAVQAVNQQASVQGNCTYIADGQSDTIVLPAGTHSGGSATLVRDVEIVGASQASTILKSGAFCTICSFGGPNGAAQDIGLRNLTLQHDAASTFSVYGALISSTSQVYFHTQNVRVTGYGATGVELDGSLVTGNISNSTVDTNSTGVGCGSCILQILNSTIRNNASGGVVMSQFDIPHYNYVVGTLFQDNRGANGAGLFLESAVDSDEVQTLDVSACTFRGNHASGSGGGLYVQANTNVFGSVFENNVSDSGYGGGFAADTRVQGAGYAVTITDSTFNNNRGVVGGGFAGHDSSDSLYVGIFNSTFSNNTASSDGGGIYSDGHMFPGSQNLTVFNNRAARGGGLFRTGSREFSLFHSTFSGNQATATTTPPSGGGLHVDAGGGIVVNYNVFSGNTPRNVRSVPIFAAARYNLLDNATGAPANMIGGTNLAPAPAKLGPVGFYGGSTQVISLLPGSPALDVIPASEQAIDPAANADQRGVLRPQLGSVDATKTDIGAFESARLETEVLTVAAKSAVTHAIVTNASYSAGKGTNLQATGANQFVTYSSGAAVVAANYNLTVGFKKGTSAGQFQVSVGPSASGPWVNLPVQNARASADSWVTTNFGNVTAGTTGTKFFRFMVPSGATTPVQIFPDFVQFTRQ